MENIYPYFYGCMSEWIMVPAPKAGKQKYFEGSNPSTTVWFVGGEVYHICLLNRLA